MIRSWRWRVVAVTILGLGAACSKGATTLDEDAKGLPAANGRAGSEAGDDEVTTCGNEQIDDGEDCDGVLLDGVTCVNLGFTGGQLGCDPVICTFATSMCTRPATGGGGDGA